MDDLYAKLLESSFRFLSFRPRSAKEVRDFLSKKLQKRKVGDTGVTQRVLGRLRDLGYIDDAKFVSWWVDQRASHRPKAARLIAMELRAKGVEAKDMNLDETALAHRAVEKKLSLWHKLPKLEQKKKIYGFLGRRGFGGETIHRIIDELIDGEVE